MDMTCDHSGARSGAARYVHEAAQLRLILVCDQCGAECWELGRLDYGPNARCSLEHVAKLSPRDPGLTEAKL